MNKNTKKRILQYAEPKALQKRKPIIGKHTDLMAKPAAEIQRTSPAEGPTSEMAGVEVKKFLCELTGVAGFEIAHQILSQMKAMQIWGPDSPERNMKAVEMYPSGLIADDGRARETAPESKHISDR